MSNKIIEPHKYKNRYTVEYTFTPDEDGNILWEGDFNYCRVGTPNDYTKAYKAYYDKECLPPHDHTYDLEQFIEKIHEWNDVEDSFTDFSEKYRHLIISKVDEINMVDPSGGCYLTAGMFSQTVHPEIIGKKIVKFEPIKTGYKIILG